MSLTARLLGIVSPDEMLAQRDQIRACQEPEELVNLCWFRLRRDFTGANTVDVPVSGFPQSAIDSTVQLFRDKGWHVVFDPPFWLAFSLP